MFNFLRRQQWYHLFGCETNTNRAITAQSWDYLMYLRDLAVHKDHLSHHRMTSQSALLSWRHLLTVGNIIKCLHDDISGPCVSLLILAPEQAGTVPLNQIWILFFLDQRQLRIRKVQINVKVKVVLPQNFQVVGVGHSENGGTLKQRPEVESVLQGLV